MATAKHIIITFALVLFSTQAAIPNEPKISNTHQASCVVTIIRDYKIIPLSGEAITNLIYLVLFYPRHLRCTKDVQYPQN